MHAMFRTMHLLPLLLVVLPVGCGGCGADAVRHMHDDGRVEAPRNPAVGFRLTQVACP